MTTIRPSKLTGVLGLFFIFVFLPCESSAQFKAQWQTSMSLGAEKPDVTHEVGWGRTDARLWSSDLGVAGRSSGSGFLGTTPEELSRRSSGEFGFSNWRDNVNMAAAEGRGQGGMSSAGGDKANFRHSVSFTTAFEWSKYNQHNELIGFRGICWGLGFISKNYFNPPSKEAWNGFWHWGTVYLILPFIGVGTEYTTDHVFFEVGTFYILPYLNLGVHF